MKLKNWIIRKLGGYVVDDIPLDLRIQIMQRWAGKTMDANIRKTFEL